MSRFRLTREKEYWNVVREYSPPECVTNMGKLVNIFDNILLGENTTQIAFLKHFFRSPVDTPNVDFAAGLPFLYNLQTHSWLPCLNEEANPSFCRELTSPTVLFPKAKTSESKARIIISDGGWANETESLEIALLNYLGYVLEFHKEPTDKSLYERDGLEGSGLDLKIWAWHYQLCTVSKTDGRAGLFGARDCHVGLCQALFAHTFHCLGDLLTAYPFV